MAIQHLKAYYLQELILLKTICLVLILQSILKIENVKLGVHSKLAGHLQELAVQ